jgi:hypothetical protein
MFAQYAGNPRPVSIYVVARGDDIILISIDKHTVDAVAEPGDRLLNGEALSGQQRSYVDATADRDGLCLWSFRPQGWKIADRQHQPPPAGFV